MEEKLISSIQAAEKEAVTIRTEAEQEAGHMREDALAACEEEIQKTREEYRSREDEILEKAREDADAYGKERMGKAEKETTRFSDMTRRNMPGAIEFILHFIFEEHNGHIEDDSHNSGRQEG